LIRSATANGVPRCCPSACVDCARGCSQRRHQGRKDKDKPSEGLVRAGEIMSLSPTSMEIQGPRRVTKIIRAPILLCVSYLTLNAMDAGSSDHRELERRDSQSPSATFVMRLRSVAIAGHMLPVGLVCSHRHCERPVAWIVLSYCGSYSLPLHRPGFNDSRDEINKVGQSNYRILT
jgi:hypothetical protein